MNNEKVVQESVWDCRRTKIELEHEVLLREMEAVLIGIVGLPIAIITIAVEFKLWQNASSLLALGFFTIIVFLSMEAFRSDRKEKIVAKEKELDALVLEITKSNGQVPKSR
jgi:hypothetical protein